MDNFKISIQPQYVRQTDEEEFFPDGKKHPLHLVQKRMKLDFESFPEFTIITAPTGTGKSYAFPFPVINSKKRAGAFKSSIRGLIVLPTNALIDELTANFQDAYSPNLNVVNITGAVLNELQKKNFDRWRAILDLASESDLAITNPDIINYAMHGGYHKRKSEFWKGKTGRKEIPDFLQKFSYIIFDEYHLYDESQIANLWTLIQLRNLFLQENNKIKYFFVSATPEKALKEFLKSRGSVVEEIIEEITTDPKQARVIHGKLAVEFFSTNDLESLVLSKESALKKQFEQKKKALIILNNLRAVLNLTEALTQRFPNQVIYASTGYGHGTKDESHQEEVDKADLIIATNKAEVGVNYGVEYCIMQTGMFYQNFVQRFGRVSRGNLEGTVVVAVENVIYNKLKKIFQNEESLDYYRFTGKMREVLQPKKFYKELIPSYYGEYVWCIRHNIRKHQNYNTRILMKERLSEIDFFKDGIAYSRYKLMKDINAMIWEMKNKYKTGHLTRQWSEWWEAFLDSYLTFRDASLVVEFFDKKLNRKGNYSLDWILQNKEILDIEIIDKSNYQIKKYTVGELKDRDKDIEYTVTTIPSVKTKENEFLSYNDVINDKNLQKKFKKAILGIEDKLKNGLTPFDELQKQLVKKLKGLGKTFNKKRLKIENIEGKDSFL